MANQLTGQYDASVQIALRQINGLLATLHQSGTSDEAPLRLLHSVATRIGDRRKRPPDVDLFGEWVLEYQSARSRGIRDAVRSELLATVPPGAAQRLSDAFDALNLPPFEPAPVRGTAWLQLSSVSVSVPPGSTSEVTTHAQVRARYVPDADTTDLPAPIHGEVQAAFDVRQAPSATGRRLVIQATSQDSKIQFIAAPGTGLSASDVASISAQVRDFVRAGMSLLPVDLPSDFPFSEFKGIGGGDTQAIALGIQLSKDVPPPSGGLQGVAQSLVGPAGFAFAVSSDFTRSVFEPTLQSLRDFRRDFEVPLPGPNPTYHFSVTSADLQFGNGAIDLVIRGKATHPILPDFDNITIKQRFTLVMFLDTLFITALDEELTVSGFPGADGVKAAIIEQRNAALPPAQEALNRQLRDARVLFNTALHSFDGTASASFRSGHSEEPAAATSGGIAIVPDGIIIRGDIAGGGRFASVIEIGETDQHTAFTAFRSWIPGGRIDRFTWSWVEHPPRSGIWGGVTKSASDEHRFVFPKPAGITNVSQVCLQIDGTQLQSDGRPVVVSGGAACHLPAPDIILDVPSWWEPLTLPVWFPDLPDDVRLRDAIAGHVSVLTDRPRQHELTQNSLVYFADWPSPLDALVDGLSRVRRPDIPLNVILVLPAGAFEGRRREGEDTLARLRDRVSAHLHVTEDDEGGWSRMFGRTRSPSMYLLNSRREFVWKHEGSPSGDALAVALDTHLLPAPVPRGRPLRLAVSPGDRAPDAAFHHNGADSALRRLRGRCVLVNFWQSWSAPCLAELRRLQRLYRQQPDPPLVIAFHGGNDAKEVDGIRQALGLSFPLVQDSQQQVARTYGVRCWPTTIRIDADGRVEHVQFGAPRDHDKTGHQGPVG